MHIATTKRLTSDNGSKRIHPNRISISKRIRGMVDRIQMNRYRKKNSFATNHIGPGIKFNAGIGAYHPPKNKHTMIAEMMIMFAYSPMKYMANFIDEYSV